MHDPFQKITNAAGTQFTTRFKRWLFEQAGGICQYCGDSMPDALAMHVDHVIPRSLGGPTEVDNLRAACAVCNSAKHAGDLTRLRDSIRVRRSPLAGILLPKQVNQLEAMGVVLPVEPTVLFHFEKVAP